LDEGDSDFAGRRIRKRSDRILIDQEKYILEEMKPVALDRGRASQKESLLSQREMKEFRSMTYKVSWVAGQSRPEASGCA